MVNDSNIITINSTESKMKINKFSGNHKQATREGYSLVDISSLGSGTLQGVSYSVEDDVVTLNGAYTGSSAIPVGSLINSIPRKNATFRLQLVPVSGSSENSNIGIRFNKPNGSGQNEQLNYIQLAGTQNNYTTKAMDLTELSIVNFFFASNTSATFNNYKFKLMLTEGAEEKEYEQYGVSPSIDYPSEIETVGDNINYFNKDSATQGKYLNYQNQEIENSAWTYSDYIPCKPNENWIISGYNAIGGAPARCFYDKNKSFLSGGAHNNQETMMKFTTPDNCYFFRESIAKADIDTVKIEKGNISTTYSPYNQGSEKITVLNSNFLEKQEQSTVTAYGITADVKTDGSIVVNGTTTIDLYIRLTTELQISAYNETNNWKKYHLPQGSYKFSCDISGTSSGSNIHAYIKENNVIGKTCSVLPNLVISKENTFELTDKIEYVVYVWIQGGTNLTDFTMKFMLKKSDDTSDYVQNKQKEYVLEVQQEILQGDYFVKEADGWKEVHTLNKKTFYGTENIGTSASGNSFTYVTNDLLNNTSQTDILSFYSNCYVASSWEERNYQSKPNTVASYGNSIGFDKGNFATPEEFKAELAEKYSQGNPMYLYYPLATPTKLACTSEQITVLNELQNILLYDDTTHIVLGDIYPILDYDVSKIVDTTMTFEASLDENGYFVVPDYNIKCLVSYSESNIPTMPEAVESTVRVAGKDGDVVLGTTYEPIAFTIVCYTDDNLSIEEKNAEELKMNNFLNSIKDKTIRLKNDSKNIFYNVKYNGLLTTINYPKHLQFSIPLKTSASFANNIEKSYMLGNATKQSNTAKKVGAIFTIAGPAQTPKIYLNDYEMFYNNVILSGAKLIIDSNRSTVTMVGRDGNLTNAMRYYNHEFPKIENGENVLKVSSGIDEDRQVSVEWFDLKL